MMSSIIGLVIFLGLLYAFYIGSLYVPHPKGKKHRAEKYWCTHRYLKWNYQTTNGNGKLLYYTYTCTTCKKDIRTRRLVDADDGTLMIKLRRS